MKRWITSLVSPNRKPEPVEPPEPPAAAPSGQPAGIDHLMARGRPAGEAVEAAEQDHYSSLMPVRRLADTTQALQEAPAAPDMPPPPLVVPQPAVTVPQSPAVPPPEAAQPAKDTTETPEPQAPSTSAPPSPPPPQVQAPPVRGETLHVLADMAYKQRDFAVAADWWWLMRLGFPNVFHGFADGARALLELDRFDEARELLEEAAPRFPDEPGFPVTRAQLEARTGNLDASVAHWRDAMQLPTCPWWACTRLAETLERQSRFDEADAVLAQGISDPRFRTPLAFAKAVSVAVVRKDWPAVVERLGALGSACSDENVLSLNVDAILIPLRDADPAGLEAALKEPWVARVLASEQKDPWRLISQARLAQLSGRTADVMARLATARASMPENPDAYLRVEATLRDAGFPDAADALLAEAKTRFPGNAAIWMRAGAAKEARGDWAGAAAHWTEMEQTFPPGTVPVERLQQANQRLQESQPVAEVPVLVEDEMPHAPAGASHTGNPSG